MGRAILGRVLDHALGCRYWATELLLARLVWTAGLDGQGRCCAENFLLGCLFWAEKIGEKYTHIHFHHQPPPNQPQFNITAAVGGQPNTTPIAAPPPCYQNFHQSVSKTETDHEDRLPTIYPVVLRVSRSDLRCAVKVQSKPLKSPKFCPHFAGNFSLRFRHRFVHCSDWARLKLPFASHRRFAAVGTNDGRGPPPLDLPLHCESNETLPTNFHQVPDDIQNFKFFAVAWVAPPFPPPPGARSPSDNYLCVGLSVANKITRLDSDNGASPEMESFTFNPDEFPPLTSTNPSESTQTNSAKTTSFQKGQNTESAARQPANRLAKDSNFSNFFLANSNPPPIGATHDINGRPTIWYLNGFPIRVFKWTPTFTPEQESSITPIWVNFPELPAHLYRKDALFAIANNIGTPLQIADSTLNQSNLAKARICVEIDLLKPLLKEIHLKICGPTIVQNIVYEHIPNYCSLCKHVRHRDAECYSKGDAPKPPPHRWNFRKKAKEKYKLKGKAVAQDV
ncbi:hypothetical protein Sango_2503300 [Sesamum angolense]|uniref:DUF4283 domain-containing protein n=1 Tax=Sesamum angolense TaxID=2727404 RepID=A0AAE2BI65_9LAMI|nr:hypothetical protein Sango_2503300 [Sesamum angolense]